MPAAELALFRQNLAFARDLVATAVVLRAQTTVAVQTDDLLRSALVQGVSAFDHFVHEEVRARMLLIESGSLRRARGYDRFRVSLASVSDAMISRNSSWLESEIREQHTVLSFQHPDRVADGFRLVTDIELWNVTSRRMGRPTDDVKRQLRLIVDRRNKIVHEADTDPTPPRQRYPIDDLSVTTSLDFLEATVDAISTELG